MTTRSLSSELPLADKPGRRWLAPLFALLACGALFAAGYRVLSLNLLQTQMQIMVVGGLFALLFIFGLVLLITQGRVRSANGIFICAFLMALALLVRIYCLDHVSDDYSMFLSKWVGFFRSSGGFSALSESIGDYNVPYLYFLAAISYIQLPDLYLIKFLSVLFEVLTAWSVFLLTRHLVSGKFQSEDGHLFPRFWAYAPPLAFFMVLFLPTVFFNGAVWGQCDSIYVAFVLFALYAALKHHGAEAVMLMAIAFSFKLQAIFLLPLFLILLFTKHVKWYQLFLFPVVYCVICLPALLMGRPFLDIFQIYFHQASQYPSLAMNAPSLASFLPLSADVVFWERVLIFAAAAFVFVLVVIGLILHRRLTSRGIVVLALLMAVGVPLLLPHMHERYFMLAEVLAVVWACSRADRIFLPALIQVASLGGYHAYLLLQYIYPLKYGAVLLCLSLPVLFFDLFQSALTGRRKEKEEEDDASSPPADSLFDEAEDTDGPNIDLSLIAELADAPPELEEEQEDLSSDLPPSLQMAQAAPPSDELS
ncbi:MAG: conjugal transfer protein TraL [Oscillospiraceae bacterium]|nr:conjugal transfer protein TraL [Oscillospiraceae bacterium]